MTQTEEKIAMVEGTETNEKRAIEMGEETLRKIVDGLVSNGKLLISGINGHGKTNAMKWILRFIMNTEEYKRGKYKLRITDSTNVWRWSYDSIPFVDIVKTTKIPEDAHALILDLGFSDVDNNIRIISNMMLGDYTIQREDMAKNEGKIPTYRITAIEEIQSVLGSYGLNSKSSKFFFKIVSEGRNLGIFLLGTTQRFADLSTRFVERTRYFLLGAVSGANDITKIKGMMLAEKGRRVTDCLLSLKRGEFLFLDKEQPEEGSFIIYFPKFEPIGKPYEFDEKAPTEIVARRAFL
jgi:hypothetical protein